jgi:hypothetical protein
MVTMRCGLIKDKKKCVILKPFTRSPINHILFSSELGHFSMADGPIIRRRVALSRRTRNGLIRFARDNTSQNGEDGIIAHLFQLLPTTAHENNQEERDRRRICVDVGAWDGRHLSNTFSLLVPSSSNANQEEQNGDNFPTKPWRGILVEADTERFQMLESLHEPLGNQCLNVKVSCLEGSPDGLVPLLQQYDGTCNELPVDFDFVCIDVDGSDYWLLEDVWNVGQYRPKVVCVEFNPTMPDDLIYIPSRSSGDTIRHGASLSALVELAQQYEYTLVETTLYNAFFVRKDLYQEYLMELVPDTSIEALHEITMGTSLYQLYDGTIKLWGCKKLLWHRVPIDEAKLQVLTPELRHFPFAPSQALKGESHLAIHNRAIDMSSYCRPSSQEHDTATTLQQQQRACANELVAQLKKDGFCCIRGTGMSRTLCQTALSVTNSFMQEANEDVRRSCLTKDRARRGYSPMCTENFASLIGETGPNDLVRKFRMGPPSSRSIVSEVSMMTRRKAQKSFRPALTFLLHPQPSLPMLVHSCDPTCGHQHMVGHPRNVTRFKLLWKSIMDKHVLPHIPL